MFRDRKVSSSARRKITVACETCRKRKGRCSGTVPCTLCLKHNLECHYEINRRKRGPRARMTDDNCSSTVSRPLLPSAPEQGVIFFEIASSPASVTADGSVDPSRACMFPDLAVRQKLRRIHDRPDYQIDGLTQDVIVHLLEIFFTVVNQQQLPLLPPDQGLDWLLEKDRPAFVVASLCLVSIGYSSHERASAEIDSPLDAKIAPKCRLMLLQADIVTQQLDRMLCLCALALYEMSNGNGTQGWCDIGTAQSLIPLISQSEMGTLSKDVFKTCLSFLAWTRAEFSLGNPTLVPYVLACNDIEPDIDLGELCGPADVQKAASLLVRCADYAIRTPRNETPWQNDSTFSKLKLKLDQFSITIAENPDLDPGGFSASLADRSELVVDITMSLLRDYCSILLNRNFLPMPPLLSRTHENSATEAQPSKLFFDGRVSACEGSAESIYELCTVLISNQLFILPPFLGYCCFQAALIFASSLVGYKDQTRREETFYRLQVLCMVLGALRRLYKPTKLWIDALLKIRAALNETRSEPETARSTDENFFSRFRDVVEPPLITLTCPKVDDIHTEANTTGNTTPKAVESCQARPAPWIESYQMRLNEQVSALGSIHEESPKDFGDAATGSAKFNNQIAAQLDSLAGQEPSETVQPAVDMHNVAASDSSNTFYGTHACSLDNDPGLSLGIENLICQPQSQMVTDGGLLEEMVDETMQVEGPDFFSIDFSQYFDIGESMLDTFGFNWKE